MATRFDDGVVAAGAGAQEQRKRYLHGPIADFITFGGSSLIILPLLLVVPAERYLAAIAFAAMVLANFINHPHFAHSYQIFYRGFARKAFTSALGGVMQTRYLLAGVVAPLLLAGFLIGTIWQGEVRTLGLAANAMAFFVGWHYVKQGYGLLMVDCALKRQFFRDTDKKLLLINSYAVWIASWVYVNTVAAESQLWGIAYVAFALPQWVQTLTAAAALGSTAVTAWMLFSVGRSRGALPVNGVIAYIVSLYIWLAFVRINPVWLLLTPALHSLQYLAVVYRFEGNFAKEQIAARGGNPAGKPLAMHLGTFALAGAALGFLGFWLGPIVASNIVAAPKAAFGAGVFLFAAWVFINVHHYFMDNVMWRRDNPDSKKYLFG